MIMALAQGLVGSGQKALNPSLRALGPNVYIGERDFLTMMGVALIVHLLVFGIASLIPPKPVTDIPVRALSFKIGDSDRVAAYGTPTEVGTTMAAPTPAPTIPTTEWGAAPIEAKPKPVPREPERRIVPEENRPAALSPVEQPKPQPVIAPVPQPLAALTDTPPAIAPAPQRFIREVGAAPQAGQPAQQPHMGQGIQAGAIGGHGNQNTMTKTTEQVIRERYEQHISTWIEQHKLYPAAAAGREGKAVVRMRIDRMGFVRYYALEQSSGNDILDLAAVDMVRRANPVPAAPANYPAGALIEFLVPISFKVPQ